MRVYATGLLYDYGDSNCCGCYCSTKYPSLYTYVIAPLEYRFLRAYKINVEAI